MHEHIRAILAFNEAITFACIEPLDSTCYPLTHLFLLLTLSIFLWHSGVFSWFNYGLLIKTSDPNCTPCSDRFLMNSRKNTRAISINRSLSGIFILVKVLSYYS